MTIGIVCAVTAMISAPVSSYSTMVEAKVGGIGSRSVDD